ncbi:sporulation membrane protein YtaF [Aquibacillus salsiterrae]|uniref:Sporulation membrane protein YtaF n=1 Tax=Aquibacillus salsiterrae TaxID=2950439 RepID=A0A9X4AEZ0_9BACI|nr:sporulation membrane protein YtaF [Aquibacillus salsiterrae]MDC3417326.1 sporulation membrane protein YtaF [Aquibacillus salsiterrae]
MIGIDYLYLFILGLAVSLDGFGVGLSYGIRKIKIPLPSILVITICTGVMVFAAMEFGGLLTKFTSVDIANKIGAFILIGIGLWATINYFRNNEKKEQPSKQEVDNKTSNSKVIRINLQSLGLIIEILKVPSAADIDKSGIIKGWEAVLLGIALSLDAFGAGIGASFMGFPPIITAITITFFSYLLIFSGMKIGLIFSEIKWLRFMSFLPGFILIVIGITRLIN